MFIRLCIKYLTLIEWHSKFILSFVLFIIIINIISKIRINYIKMQLIISKTRIEYILIIITSKMYVIILIKYIFNFQVSTHINFLCITFNKPYILNRHIFTIFFFDKRVSNNIVKLRYVKE